VLAGGVGVSLVIRRWARRGAAARPAAPPPAPGDDERRQQLARALADFDRET
jgi:hypothetical protein